MNNDLLKIYSNTLNEELKTFKKGDKVRITGGNFKGNVGTVHTPIGTGESLLGKCGVAIEGNGYISWIYKKHIEKTDGFKKGDKVRITGGSHKGKTGTVNKTNVDGHSIRMDEGGLIWIAQIWLEKADEPFTIGDEVKTTEEYNNRNDYYKGQTGTVIATGSTITVKWSNNLALEYDIEDLKKITKLGKGDWIKVTKGKNEGRIGKIYDVTGYSDKYRVLLLSDPETSLVSSFNTLVNKYAVEKIDDPNKREENMTQITQKDLGDTESIFLLNKVLTVKAKNTKTSAYKQITLKKDSRMMVVSVSAEKLKLVAVVDGESYSFYMKNKEALFLEYFRPEKDARDINRQLTPLDKNKTLVAKVNLSIDQMKEKIVIDKGEELYIQGVTDKAIQIYVPRLKITLDIQNDKGLLRHYFEFLNPDDDAEIEESDNDNIAVTVTVGDVVKWAINGKYYELLTVTRKGNIIKTKIKPLKSDDFIPIELAFSDFNDNFELVAYNSSKPDDKEVEESEDADTQSTAKTKLKVRKTYIRCPACGEQGGVEVYKDKNGAVVPPSKINNFPIYMYSCFDCNVEFEDKQAGMFNLRSIKTHSILSKPGEYENKEFANWSELKVGNEIVNKNKLFDYPSGTIFKIEKMDKASGGKKASSRYFTLKSDKGEFSGLYSMKEFNKEFRRVSKTSLDVTDSGDDNEIKSLDDVQEGTFVKCKKDMWDGEVKKGTIMKMDIVERGVPGELYVEVINPKTDTSYLGDYSLQNLQDDFELTGKTENKYGYHKGDIIKLKFSWFGWKNGQELIIKELEGPRTSDRKYTIKLVSPDGTGKPLTVFLSSDEMIDRFERTGKNISDKDSDFFDDIQKSMADLEKEFEKTDDTDADADSVDDVEILKGKDVKKDDKLVFLNNYGQEYAMGDIVNVEKIRKSGYGGWEITFKDKDKVIQTHPNLKNNFFQYVSKVGNVKNGDVETKEIKKISDLKGGSVVIRTKKAWNSWEKGSRFIVERFYKATAQAFLGKYTGTFRIVGEATRYIYNLSVKEIKDNFEIVVNGSTKKEVKDDKTSYSGKTVKVTSNKLQGLSKGDVLKILKVKDGNKGGMSVRFKQDNVTMTDPNISDDFWDNIEIVADSKIGKKVTPLELKVGDFIAPTRKFRNINDGEVVQVIRIEPVTMGWALGVTNELLSLQVTLDEPAFKTFVYADDPKNRNKPKYTHQGAPHLTKDPDDLGAFMMNKDWEGFKEGQLVYINKEDHQNEYGANHTVTSDSGKTVSGKWLQHYQFEENFTPVDSDEKPNPIVKPINKGDVVKFKTEQKRRNGDVLDVKTKWKVDKISNVIRGEDGESPAMKLELKELHGKGDVTWNISAGAFDDEFTIVTNTYNVYELELGDLVKSKMKLNLVAKNEEHKMADVGDEYTLLYVGVDSGKKYMILHSKKHPDYSYICGYNNKAFNRAFEFVRKLKDKTTTYSSKKTLDIGDVVDEDDVQIGDIIRTEKIYKGYRPDELITVMDIKADGTTANIFTFSVDGIEYEGIKIKNIGLRKNFIYAKKPTHGKKVRTTYAAGREWDVKNQRWVDKETESKEKKFIEAVKKGEYYKSKEQVELYIPVTKDDGKKVRRDVVSFKAGLVLKVEDISTTRSTKGNKKVTFTPAYNYVHTTTDHMSGKWWSDEEFYKTFDKTTIEEEDKLYKKMQDKVAKEEAEAAEEDVDTDDKKSKEQIEMERKEEALQKKKADDKKNKKDKKDDTKKKKGDKKKGNKNDRKRIKFTTLERGDIIYSKKSLKVMPYSRGGRPMTYPGDMKYVIIHAGSVLSGKKTINVQPLVAWDGYHSGNYTEKEFNDTFYKKKEKE